MAPRKDISFKTVDGLTLRGWLFTPDSTSAPTKLPCLVMSHGFTALKEMDLDAFASAFVSALPLACLVYDNRNFGGSDGEPRQEIIPPHQTSDISDAITYAQTLEEVDPEKIGIWGSSYSGGHVLHVGAVDKRVKAVLSQVPMVDGYGNFDALLRPDFVAGMDKAFQDGKSTSARGDCIAPSPTAAFVSFWILTEQTATPVPKARPPRPFPSWTPTQPRPPPCPHPTATPSSPPGRPNPPGRTS
jgi:pimeloyl-ACP methyl ester carboxylesterase